jgi:hypothetical protein
MLTILFASDITKIRTLPYRQLRFSSSFGGLGGGEGDVTVSHCQSRISLFLGVDLR